MMGWRKRYLAMVGERNELADQASSASVAVECIASEVRVITSNGGVALPVIEQHLDTYYRRVGREWRR